MHTCLLLFDGFANRNDDCSIPGWQSFPPGMRIDESQDGDRCMGWRRSLPGWQSMHPPWRSMHPGMVIMHPRMHGYHCILGWRSRDDDRCIPGWRSRHPWMAIDASRVVFLGWRSQHPWMAIDAPGMTIAAPLGGDRFISGWRSMHHGMVIDASGGGDRYTRSGVAASLVGDRCISR